MPGLRQTLQRVPNVPTACSQYHLFLSLSLCDVAYVRCTIRSLEGQHNVSPVILWFSISLLDSRSLLEYVACITSRFSVCEQGVLWEKSEREYVCSRDSSLETRVLEQRVNSSLTPFQLLFFRCTRHSFLRLSLSFCRILSFLSQPMHQLSFSVSVSPETGDPLFPHSFLSHMKLIFWTREEKYRCKRRMDRSFQILYASASIRQLFSLIIQTWVLY